MYFFPKMHAGCHLDIIPAESQFSLLLKFREKVHHFDFFCQAATAGFPPYYTTRGMGQGEI